MVSIDCPFCSGEAHVEGRLDAVTCDGCGVTVDVAPDAVDALDIAA
jgi:hypothetical protein